MSTTEKLHEEMPLDRKVRIVVSGGDDHPKKEKAHVLRSLLMTVRAALRDDCLMLEEENAMQDVLDIVIENM